MWDTFLYVSHRNRDGNVDWWVKCYTLCKPLRPGGPLIFWEIRGIVQSLEYTSKGWDMNDWLKGQWTSLKEWWDHLGVLPVDFISSRRSSTSPKKTKPGATLLDEDDCPNEHVVSSDVLISCLAFWTFRLSNHRKHLAREVLRQVIAMLPAMSLKSVYCEPLFEYPCKHMRGNDTVCRTVLAMEHRFQELYGRQQHVHIADIIMAMSAKADCGVACTWLAGVIARLSGMLDAKIPHMGLPTTPVGPPVLRGAKRARRLDDAVVKLHSIDVVRSKKARSAACYARSQEGGLAVSTARSTELTTTSNYLWQSNQCFEGVVHASVCLDASRLGGEDTLHLGIWSPQKQRAAWLPPQVFNTGL